jgi:Tol biopolymer transport system component
VLAGTVAAALPAGARVHDAFVNVDVFSVTLAGKTRAVAASPTLDSKPAVAPNGKTVAFVSARSGSPDIYLINPNGGNVRRLTTSPFTVGGGTPQMVNSGDFDAGETSIAWSPDSKQLAFTAVNAKIDPSCFAHCFQGSLFVVDADGTGLRLLDTAVQSPVWSPDGNFIAYEGDMSPYGDVGAYYVADSTGGRKVKFPAVNGDDSPPTFSPDSKRIAFQTYRYNSVPAEIDIADVTGKHRHKLTVGYEPAWSRFGLIAYVRGKRIHAIHPDGTSDRILTKVTETAFSPAWSPTAKRVAFVSHPAKANRCQVAVVTLPGGAEKQLTREPARSSPDSRLSWTPNGGAIYFARSLPPSGGCG